MDFNDADGDEKMDLVRRENGREWIMKEIENSTDIIEYVSKDSPCASNDKYSLTNLESDHHRRKYDPSSDIGPVTFLMARILVMCVCYVNTLVTL